MNRIRNILSFLLIAGAACVQAQQPIVKINSDSLSTECDVTAAAGAPIFQLDATGNVLVKGALSGQGCGGVTNSTPTFGLIPPASGVVVNGGSTVAAGSAATVPLTYQAYNADSCGVGTPTTTAGCPAITASSSTCNGSGAQKSCAPSGATLSIPTIAQMATNTSCAYTVKATCLPGSVTSSAVLTVVNPGGGGNGDPPECANLATIHNSAGVTWNRLTAGTSVMYGDGTTATRDPTDYVSVWSYGATQQPWPGETSTIRPTILANLYLSSKFVASTDTSLAPKWSWTGSGINSNFAVTISKCQGDFGQTGTQLTTGCKLNQSQSSNGLTAHINATQQGLSCTLTPGGTYYLNILPDANLPVSNVATSSPSCSPKCTPYIVRNP